MIDITVTLGGVVTPNKIILGNKWENNDEILSFAMPEEFANYHKYLIGVIKQSGGNHTTVIPITNNTCHVSSNLTYFHGNWNLYVMCRELPLDLSGDIVNIKHKDNERVFISNVFIGVVNKNMIDQGDIENIPLDTNLQIVYDDLLTLKDEIRYYLDHEAESDLAMSKDIAQNKADIQAFRTKAEEDTMKALESAKEYVDDNINALSDTYYTESEVDELIDDAQEIVPISELANCEGAAIEEGNTYCTAILSRDFNPGQKIYKLSDVTNKFWYIEPDGQKYTAMGLYGADYVKFTNFYLSSTANIIRITYLVNNYVIDIYFDANGNYVKYTFSQNVNTLQGLTQLNNLSKSSSYTPSAGTDLSTKSYVDDAIAAIPEAAIADWDENDENSPAYVQNRTHYKNQILTDKTTEWHIGWEANTPILLVGLLEYAADNEKYFNIDAVKSKQGEYDGPSSFPLYRFELQLTTNSGATWMTMTPFKSQYVLIDDVNYVIANRWYVILNTAKLSDKYKDKFTSNGIYFMASNSSTTGGTRARVYQVILLKDDYISSELVTGRNLVQLDTTNKTVVGAINELNARSAGGLNDEIAPDSEVIYLLTELGIEEPLSSENNEVYIEEENVIYTL